MKAEDEQLSVLYELSSMIVHILKSPPLPIPPIRRLYSPVGHSSSSSSSFYSSWRQLFNIWKFSPIAFASLFLGISLALMLFGSVAFVIGFVLMPLVVCLVLVFYFVEIAYNLSEFGRSILCPITSFQNLHDNLSLDYSD